MTHAPCDSSERLDGCIILWTVDGCLEMQGDMSSLNRRQFVYGAGAVLGSTLIGCGRQQEPMAGSGVTVFVNGTILPVDAAFSEHAALAIADNKVLAIGSQDDVLAAVGRGAKTVD